MNSSNIDRFEEIRLWLTKQFTCYYCSKVCVVREILSKRGCFVHRSGLEYNYPIGYPFRKPLYWKCCPDKQLTSIGCISCDHADGPHPIPEHPYYVDIPLYIMSRVHLSVDNTHAKVVKVYQAPESRTVLLEREQENGKLDIMNSVVKIKRFF